MIVTKKNDVVRAKIRGRLQKICGGIRVVCNNSKREGQVVVRKMDALTVKDSKVLNNIVRMGKLRSNTRTTQVVTLILNQKAVEKLLTRGYVRIGLVNCRIDKSQFHHARGAGFTIIMHPDVKVLTAAANASKWPGRGTL